MLKEALTKAISEKGNFHQKLHVLTDEKKVKLYKAICPLMTRANGFIQATGEMQRQLRPHGVMKTTVFNLSEELSEDRFVVLETFENPRVFHHQRSNQDCTFTDEVLRIHGRVHFAMNRLFSFGESCFIPPQLIEYEFYFTQSFVEIIEQKLQELF